VSDPALFRRFPSLNGKIPFLPLGNFPTRIVRAPGIVGPAVDLWVKRDDESGTIYGGNKVRKLEFLLAEAREKKRTRLVTMGGYGSHHVLATGLYGREAGFDVDAVVFPQPVNDHVRESLLAGAACGIRYHPAASYAGLPWRVLVARLRKGAAWIAPGGSSPTGTLGYVSAGLEIGEQVARGECPAPDVVYVALGSCGTVAGLWLGLAMAGIAARVQAVRVVDRLVTNRSATLRLARATLRRLTRHQAISERADPATLTVEHRQFGDGYGHATDAGGEAIAMAQAAGISLETTYTGKTFAALVADARVGLLDGKCVLFVDTYSSVDLAPLIARSPGPDALPPRLRKLFPQKLLAS
jgi:1-aminocyclopropane-1-carboxylate deaminase/D-cysteine desulfhydrase-like pyridoxal-dependent ACC family enzyme